MSPEVASWDAAGGILHVEAVAADDPEPACRLLLAVQDALEDADRRPMVLHGCGGGFLIAGGARDPELRRLAGRTAERIAEHPLPVVAAIDAPLLDTGLELALACDLRFVRGGMPVGCPATADGWLPGGGGQRLSRLGGTSLATQLLLLGDVIDSGSDARLDRLMRVCAGTALEAAGRALAELRARAPLALEALKTAVQAAEELPLHAGVAVEADLACLLLDTRDRAEGLAAFRASRGPTFHGR